MFPPIQNVKEPLIDGVGFAFSFIVISSVPVQPSASVTVTLNVPPVVILIVCVEAVVFH